MKIRLWPVAVMALILCGASGLCYAQEVPATSLQSQLAEVEALRKEGNFSDAILKIKRLVGANDADRNTIRIELADTYYSWADVLDSGGDFYLAISRYDSAYEIDQVLRKDYAALEIAGVGHCHDELGDHELAIAYFRKGLEICGETKNSALEAGLLGAIANAYNQLHNLVRAIQYYDREIAIARTLKDPSIEASALANKANALDDLGQYNQSIQSYNQALTIVRRLKDQEGEGTILCNIAGPYVHLKEYKLALASSEQSLAILRQIKNPGQRAAALNFLGKSYFGLGQFQLALNSYAQSLVIMYETHDLDGQAVVLKNLMIFFKRTKNPLAEIMCGKQSINQMQQIRNLNANAQQQYLAFNGDNYRALAGALIQQGRLSEAVQVAQMLSDGQFVDFGQTDLPESTVEETTDYSPSELNYVNAYAGLASRLRTLTEYQAGLEPRLQNTPAGQQRHTQIQSEITQRQAQFIQLVCNPPFKVGKTTPADAAFHEKMTGAVKAAIAGLPPKTAVVYVLASQDSISYIVLTATKLAGEYFDRSDIPTHSAVPADPRVATVKRIRAVLQSTGSTTVLWSLSGSVQDIPQQSLVSGAPRYTSLYLSPSSIATVKQRLNAIQLATYPSVIARATLKLKSASNSAGRNALRIKIADTHFKWAQSLEGVSNYRAAIDQYEQAYTIDHELRLDYACDDASWIGGDLVKLNDNLTAINKFQQALVICRQLTEDRLVRQERILDGLGQANLQLSRYSAAIDFFKDALPITRKVHDSQGEVAALNNIGWSYSDLGSYDEAIQYLDQALATPVGSGNPHFKDTLLNNIGQMYYKLDQTRPFSEHEEAIKYSKQALQIAQNCGDKDVEAEALENLGTAYATYDYSLATEYYKQAVIVSQSSNNQSVEAEALFSLSTLYYKSHEDMLAHQTCEQALVISVEMQDKSLQSTVLGNLAWLQGGTPSPSAAIVCLKQGVDLYQQIRRLNTDLSPATQQRLLIPAGDMYRDLASHLAVQGRLSESLQVLELLKEDEFFQFFHDDGNEPAASRNVTYTPQEAAYVRGYSRLSNRVAKLYAQRSPSLPKAASDLIQYVDGLPLTVGQLTPQDKAVDDAMDRDAEAGVKALPAKTAIVYVMLTQFDQVQYIVVTPDKLTERWYNLGWVDLNSKISEYRSELEDPNSTIDTKLSEEIYNAIVGPVRADLDEYGAKTVVWSLDGSLRYVPVAALFDGNQYMVEKYQNLVFTPATLNNMKLTPRSNWRALGLGVAIAYPGFPPLESVSDEVKAIVNDPKHGAYGLIPGHILLNGDFKRSAIENDAHSGYALVHIATHFKLSAGNDQDSVLLLGDGSTLSLADIKSMPNNLFSGVDLLTLAACDTAVTDSSLDSGSELETFAALAQQKGAAAVLASLWPISEDTTEPLLTQFYRYYRDNPGVTKAEALQKAQLSLLEPGPGESASKYAHPYYWAPFVLMGNWR